MNKLVLLIGVIMMFTLAYIFDLTSYGAVGCGLAWIYLAILYK